MVNSTFLLCSIEEAVDDEETMDAYEATWWPCDDTRPSCIASARLKRSQNATASQSSGKHLGGRWVDLPQARKVEY